MPKFTAIIHGAAARLRGVRIPALNGGECVCDLRLLLATDDDEIIARAREHTLKKGGKPEPGDATYEFAQACELLALAAVDSDSPDEKPEQYFESSDQIRNNLDRDRINYLVELQAKFQLDHWPRKRDFTEDEYTRKILELAALVDGEKSPLADWPSSLVLSLLRTTARRLVAVEISNYRSSTTDLSRHGETTQPSLG